VEEFPTVRCPSCTRLCVPTMLCVEVKLAEGVKAESGTYNLNHVRFVSLSGGRDLGTVESSDAPKHGRLSWCR
jgi:hypothetical protein